jgi:hypothetical protein
MLHNGMLTTGCKHRPPRCPLLQCQLLPVSFQWRPTGCQCRSGRCADPVQRPELALVHATSLVGMNTTHRTGARAGCPARRGAQAPALQGQPAQPKQPKQSRPSSGQTGSGRGAPPGRIQQAQRAALRLIMHVASKSLTQHHGLTHSKLTVCPECSTVILGRPSNPLRAPA